MSETASIPPQTQPPCPKCGYLADSSAGPVNFCPKCGIDLRSFMADDERTQTHPWVGNVIADRYRLLSLIGEGGMGAVYKAEHIRMGKALALKVLRGAFAREEGAVSRFRSEAQIVSRLSHPHTIAVFDFGEIAQHGGFYLAMEYVPGKDLSTVLREEQRLPESRVAAIGEQVLGSLAEAHDSGIVHRDVKPGNIMLMRTRLGEDFAKVLDFGIAKLRDERSKQLFDQPHSATETQAGAIIGTPNYLSPEQARGGMPDVRADLYSLGVVLYELASGRCPFVSQNPMEVVEAHLTQEPPRLTDVAPGISPLFADVVHKALKKRPQDRFQTADDMRDALLELGTPEARSRLPVPPASAEVTGELRIASRKDFQEFERQLLALKRSRLSAPFALVALVLLVGLVIWRWDGIYSFIRAHAPRLVAVLPVAVRPSDLFDGEEHEPNNSPGQANTLPIPAGAEGGPGSGIAIMKGHVGAKMSYTTGDLDVFKVDVPHAAAPLAIHVEWSGENQGEGVRGLDVALALNRQRNEDSKLESAPLVATADSGGPGLPERLTAAVAPGVYYVAVREKHTEVTGPVEKPTDWYALKVWFAQLVPGQEVEPNDGPDSVEHRETRYPDWKAVAERNPLGEGSVMRGTTSTEEPDTYSVAARSRGEAPELTAVVPENRSAMEAQLWVPDTLDLSGPKGKERIRFRKPVSGGFGEVLFVKLPIVPAPAAPTLIQLRAADGEGRYEIAALGRGRISGTAVLSLMAELEKENRTAQALALAAGYVRKLPGASGRSDVILGAGRLAERVAAGLRPDEVARYNQASRLIGTSLFDPFGGRVRYSGAFELLIEGSGGVAEETSFKLITRVSPCGAGEVARRAAIFLRSHPGSSYEPQVKLLLAHALDDEYFRDGKKPFLTRAIVAYQELAEGTGRTAAEAKKRLKALSAKRPVRPKQPLTVCR